MQKEQFDKFFVEENIVWKELLDNSGLFNPLFEYLGEFERLKYFFEVENEKVILFTTQRIVVIDIKLAKKSKGTSLDIFKEISFSQLKVLKAIKRLLNYDLIISYVAKDDTFRYFTINGIRPDILSRVSGFLFSKDVTVEKYDFGSSLSWIDIVIVFLFSIFMLFLSFLVFKNLSLAILVTTLILIVIYSPYQIEMSIRRRRAMKSFKRSMLEEKLLLRAKKEYKALLSQKLSLMINPTDCLIHPTFNKLDDKFFQVLYNTISFQVLNKYKLKNFQKTMGDLKGDSLAILEEKEEPFLNNYQDNMVELSEEDLSTLMKHKTAYYDKQRLRNIMIQLGVGEVFKCLFTETNLPLNNIKEIIREIGESIPFFFEEQLEQTYLLEDYARLQNNIESFISLVNYNIENFFYLKLNSNYTEFDEERYFEQFIPLEDLANVEKTYLVKKMNRLPVVPYYEQYNDENKYRNAYDDWFLQKQKVDEENKHIAEENEYSKGVVLSKINNLKKNMEVYKAKAKELSEAYKAGDLSSLVNYFELIFTQFFVPYWFKEKFSFFYEEKNGRLHIDVLIPKPSEFPHISGVEKINKKTYSIKYIETEPEILKNQYEDFIYQYMTSIIYTVQKNDLIKYVKSLSINAYVTFGGGEDIDLLKRYVLSLLVEMDSFNNIDLRKTHSVNLIKHFENRQSNPLYILNSIEPFFVFDRNIGEVSNIKAISQISEEKISNMTNDEFFNIIKRFVETKLIEVTDEIEYLEVMDSEERSIVISSVDNNNNLIHRKLISAKFLPGNITVFDLQAAIYEKDNHNCTEVVLLTNLFEYSEDIKESARNQQVGLLSMKDITNYKN